MDWKPIETAPQSGKPMLVFDERDSKRGVRLAWMYRGDGWWKTGPNQNMRPTHWMPLPEPPQSERTGA